MIKRRGRHLHGIVSWMRLLLKMRRKSIRRTLRMRTKLTSLSSRKSRTSWSWSRSPAITVSSHSRSTVSLPLIGTWNRSVWTERRSVHVIDSRRELRSHPLHSLMRHSCHLSSILILGHSVKPCSMIGLIVSIELLSLQGILLEKLFSLFPFAVPGND